MESICIDCGLRIKFCEFCQGHISVYCPLHIMDNIPRYFSHNIRCWHTSMYNMCFCDDKIYDQCPSCLSESIPLKYEEADVSPRYFSYHICKNSSTCDECKLTKPIYTCELCSGSYCLDCRKQITFDVSPITLFGYGDAVLIEILICLPCRESRTVRSIRNIYRKRY